MCKLHFSSTSGLMGHTNKYGGNCTIRPELVEDHDKVDVINQGMSLLVSYCIIC